MLVLTELLLKKRMQFPCVFIASFACDLFAGRCSAPPVGKIVGVGSVFNHTVVVQEWCIVCRVASAVWNCEHLFFALSVTVYNEILNIFYLLPIFISFVFIVSVVGPTVSWQD